VSKAHVGTDALVRPVERSSDISMQRIKCRQDQKQRACDPRTDEGVRPHTIDLDSKSQQPSAWSQEPLFYSPPRTFLA